MAKNANGANHGAKKKSKKSISGTLLLVMIPVTAIAIIAIIVFTTMQCRSSMRELANMDLHDVTDSNARDLGLHMQDILAKSNEIAETVSTVPMSDAQIKNTVDEAKGFDQSMEPVLYIGWSDKSTVFSNDYKPAPDFDCTSRGWYKAGLDFNTLTDTEPYEDVTSGKMCVTFSRKITTPDGRTGVMGLDVFLDPLVASVESYVPLGSGKSMLFAGDSILSFADPSLNGKKISEANDPYLDTLKEYYSDKDAIKQPITIDEKEHGTLYVAASNIPGTSWVLVSSIAEGDIMSSANQLQLVSMIIMVIAIIIIALVLFLIVNKLITKPVNSLVDQITEVSNGNYTVNITKGKDNEIGLIQSEMGKYVSRMKDTIHSIKDNTNRLEEDVINSRDASEILNREATEQSNNMDSINTVMDGMNHAVDELAQNATSLAQAVSDLTELGNAANGTMGALVDKAKVGQEDMQNVAQNMTHISESMNSMNDVVEAIGESAEKINKIIEMINSISEQTNLLSLNASIEAARAGEAGRGFAVVAGEIGTLAADSSNATTEISQIIQEITQQIKELSGKSETNMMEISKSVEAVATAEGTFAQIFEDLDKTGTSMDEMIKMMGDVNDVASSVAAISEEQSASAQEVFSTVGDLTNSARQVAEQSKDLDESANHVSNSANEITKSISVFKID